MPEQDPHGDDPSLQAPPKLVEALKRLQQQSGIQVPPQIDEAALSQARLHLSHVQQLKERAAADDTVLWNGQPLALDVGVGDVPGKPGRVVPELETPAAKLKPIALMVGSLVK